MKKTILSVVAITSLIILSGCSQPDSKKAYAADQKVWECGGYTVSLFGGSKVTDMMIKTGRDKNGFMTYRGEKVRSSGLIEVDSWAMKPYRATLDGNGNFRMKKGQIWSFRKYQDGQYFLGFNKSPNRKQALGLAGETCKRIH